MVQWDKEARDVSEENKLDLILKKLDAFDERFNGIEGRLDRLEGGLMRLNQICKLK